MPEIGKDGLHSKKGGEATTPRKSSKGAGPGSTKSENEDKTTKAIEVKKTRSTKRTTEVQLFYSSNHHKWLPQQILSGKSV